jgi:hypothetical protein
MSSSVYEGIGKEEESWERKQGSYTNLGKSERNPLLSGIPYRHVIYLFIYLVKQFKYI